MTTPDELVVPAGWSARSACGELCASIQAGPGQRAEDKGCTQCAAAGPRSYWRAGRPARGRRIATDDAAAVPADSLGPGAALAKHELAEGDIVLTRTGTVGRCALVTREHAGLVCVPPATLVPAQAAGGGAGRGPRTFVACLSATACTGVDQGPHGRRGRPLRGYRLTLAGASAVCRGHGEPEAACGINHVAGAAGGARPGLPRRAARRTCLLADRHPACCGEPRHRQADVGVAAEFTAKLRREFGFDTDMKHFAIFGRCKDCSLKGSTTES
ncbi:hypothetical protein SALBM311S_10609 [Streptomyces alboniger]